MISERLVKALSNQMTAEYYSAYLYQGMSAYAESKGLSGMAHWLFMQAREEMAHGVNIYQYILDRGATPVLDGIDAPPTSFDSICHVFKEVLAHEEKVTAMINEIATLAMEEKDHACYQFILWYVEEQVEEEASVRDIVDKLELIGCDSGLLLTLDNELASRTFVNPFPKNVKLA
jgi:ferritin